jgi:hypothetical protein
VIGKQDSKKASLGQVAATIFFGLFAIGKKNTWQKDGATVTLFQVVVGAIIGFAVVLAILITIVTLVTR